jgi:GT2 family glycosyltransferase
MAVQQRNGSLMDIIIVTSTGGRELLRDCLRSLREHPLTVGKQAVYVTDNACRDQTAEMIHEEFPGVNVVTVARQESFPAANNIWLRRPVAPFTLILNPDTEVTPGALDRMLDVMRERRDVAVSGCRLVQRDGTFDHAAKRSFPTPVGALAHFTGVGRRDGAPPRLAQYRAPEVDELGAGEVDAVNGAFMLVRREAMEAVGLMDENYPTPGMEDLDWCYRFKEGGWKVWYEGGTSVIHVKGGVTVERRSRGRYRNLRHNVAFHRSIGRFYRKFYAGKRPLLDVAVYLAIATKLLIAISRSAVARRGFA